MFDSVVPAALEDVEKADDVAVGVSARVGQRVPHARLGGKVHHALEVLGLKQPGYGVGVADIRLHEPKSRMPGQQREATLLETGIVVCIEVVEPDDFITPVEQASRRVIADEASRTGYKNLHVCRMLL